MRASGARAGPDRAIATSPRARWGIGAIVAGALAFAVIAGVPNSPLATPLPAGARPPGWAVAVARWLHLGAIGRPGLIAVSLVLMAGELVAFATVLIEAWQGRVAVRPVLIGAGVALAVTVAAPVMLSRDVFSYAAYARIFALDHRDPYVAVPAAFPHDPFVAVTSAQWLRVRSPYGPAFTLLSAAIVEIWRGSPSSVIVAFKAVAGLGAAVATGYAALAARAIRPQRAALAAAIVGLNPVVVLHTVGGGHVDALIAAALAAALAVAVHGRARAGSSPSTGWRAFLVSALIVLAVLVKTVIVVVLALWLWRVVRAAPRADRARVAAAHLALGVTLTAASLAPFANGVHTSTPLASLGGVESWASPAHLVAHAARGMVGALAGGSAGTAVDLAILWTFSGFLLALLWLVGRRSWDAGLAPGSSGSPADAWGPGLLLLALTLPYLLPWYAMWFLPFLGVMQDEALAAIGMAASALLALTLIPADPFHGYSTPGVMDGVHYVVAPLMLLLLALAARRVASEPPTSPASCRAASSRPPHRDGC